MADEADRGNEAADLFLDVALKNVAPPVAPAGIGMCLNCGAEVDGDKRWCDADCRDDHLASERHRAARVTQQAAIAA